MLSNNLKQKLSNIYDLICFEDLGTISQDRSNIYRIFKDHHREVYTSNQRLVFFSKEKIPVALTEHIQKAAALIDVSNDFILLISPGDISTDLKSARINFSTNINNINHLDLSVDDATTLSPEEKFKISDSICPLPWMNLAVLADGQLKPCCIYDHKVSTDEDSEKSYNINYHDIKDYYHSQHMEDLRQSLMRGEKPSGCQGCWHKESFNNRSLRQHSLEFYGKKFYCQPFNANLNNIINLDLDLGNLCNLKCRICSWQRSSLIAAEVVSKGNKFVNTSRDSIKIFNQQSKWSEDDQTISKFNSILGQLENIESEGGEPFLYEYHIGWYQKLVDLNRAHEVRFRHSSNATIFPDHRLWPSFRSVQICLSIDDIGDRFEYQRDGGKWSEVKKVLDKYRNLNYDNLDIAFWVVVSAMNVFYLPETVKELQNYNWKIHFSVLETPSQLSLLNLTENAKSAIIEKYKRYEEIDPKVFDQIKFLIDPIEKMVPTDGINFWDYIDHFDTKRDTHYHVSHPEMADLMGRSEDL